MEELLTKIESMRNRIEGMKQEQEKDFCGIRLMNIKRWERMLKEYEKALEIVKKAG